LSGQIDIEERQLDRALKEKISVRDPACRDQQIEQHEQIADKKAQADARSVDDSRAEGFEIVRFRRQRRRSG